MGIANRSYRHADRVRAAICVALAAANGVPMTVSELIVALRVMGLDLGPQPNKLISDSIRWELRRAHVRKVGRGKFRAGDLPRSTLHYMRTRVEAYVVDPSQACVRPGGLLYEPSSEPPEQTSSLADRLAAWDAARRATPDGPPAA